MAINAPPTLSAMTGQDSITQPVWSIFFTQIYKALTGGGGPLPLASYTATTLPLASKNAGSLAYVPASGPVYSNGTHWLTMAGVIVA